MSTVLKMEHIEKVYGNQVRALHDISLEVRAGEFVAVIGPSGSGKSTVADMLTGLVLPDSGQVLIDGVPIRACTPFTDSLTGRHVSTVEGLTDEEKKLYTYAYGEAGAVQCGFCIPGMVLCTKALLDRNLNPTDDQIRYALRNNYCRCTGYVKIMDAVRLAAKCRREGVIPEASENDWKLGSSVHRIDVEEKVLGYGKYPDDWYLLPDGCCGPTCDPKQTLKHVL